ncbi:MAG: N-acetyltransferase [Candidatus Omnitrophica bacterium]|nr:N-acetyltransferase [Candidatus Omnitrophota bacterium]
MRYQKHSTAIVSDEAVIGEGTRIWAFVNIQSNVKIGANCNICDCSFIERGASLGNGVTIKNGVSVFEGVTLEDDVFVGPNVTFVNDRYPRSHNANWKLEAVVVRKGASLGANATILCGVEIGEYAVVGAGSVVTKNVPSYAIVAGNPARQIGKASREGTPHA